MELTEMQALASKLLEIKEAKRNLREMETLTEEELFKALDQEKAQVVVFPDNDGVIREASIKRTGRLDPTIVSKVYDLLPESVVDSNRKLVETKEVVTTKTEVDAVRARQLEKMGGAVAEVIQEARAIQRRNISFKEAK